MYHCMFHYEQGSAEEEDEAAQSRKEAKLNKLEEQWKVEQEISSSWWYWSPISLTFPSNVIANLQVGKYFMEIIFSIYGLYPTSVPRMKPLLHFMWPH